MLRQNLLEILSKRKIDAFAEQICLCASSHVDLIIITFVMLNLKLVTLIKRIGSV